MKPEKVLLQILVVAVVVLLSADCKFLPERLRIIDQKGNNFILRGNLPIDETNNNTFQGE